MYSDRYGAMKMKESKDALSISVYNYVYKGCSIGVEGGSLLLPQVCLLKK